MLIYLKLLSALLLSKISFWPDILDCVPILVCRRISPIHLVWDGGCFCYGSLIHRNLEPLELYFIPLKLEYLRIMVFILVIAVLVQLVEILLKKPSQSISGHGIYLPLITTNCAILAVTFGVDYNYNLLQVVIYSISVALGFTVATVLLAGIREKLRYAKVPSFYRGYPMAFIVTALLAIAFIGFKGLIK